MRSIRAALACAADLDRPVWHAAAGAGLVALVIALVGCSGAAPVGEPSSRVAANAASVETPTPAATPARTSAPSPTPSAVVPLTLDVPPPVDLVPAQTLEWPGVSTLVPAKDGLWTVDHEFSRVVRRDPVTGHVLARIDPVGPVYANTLAFGALWTTDFDHDLVHRYDLRTGDHEQIAVGPGPDAILATVDSIWVADHQGDSLERIDPSTRAIRAVQVRDSPGRGGPGGMVEAGGLIWVAVPIPGLVVAVDPETMSVRRSEPVAMLPCGAAASAVVVWVDACDDTPSAIATLDVAGGEASVRRLADRASVVGRIAGRDWLLLDGTLVAVEPSSFHAVAAYRLDVPIAFVVPDGDDVWLVSDRRVDRVPATAFGR